MAERKKTHRRLRAFCAAFSLTFCLLVLGGGLMVADYNTRRVAFGDSSLRIDYRVADGQLMIDNMGRKEAVPIPQEALDWMGRVWNLLPARWRAAAYLTGAERAAAPAVIEKLEAVEAEYQRDYDRIPSREEGTIGFHGDVE